MGRYQALSDSGRNRKAGRWLPSESSGGLARRLRARRLRLGGARRLLVRTGLRLVRLAVAVLAALTPAAMAALSLVRPALAGFMGLGRRRLAHPGDGLADQAFDGGHGLAVDRRHDGDGGAAQAGAAGAADAVDVIVGVMRHVEIEDVADRGDIETARGDVGRDQHGDIAVAE